MQRNRDSFQHGRVLKREGIRKVIDDALGHHDILSKRACAAKVSAGDTDHLPVIAQIDLSLETELTLAAVDGGIEGYAIARLELAHTRARCGYHACRFMAHDDGRNPPAGSAVVAVYVAAADSAGRDTHQDLVRTRYGRRDIRNVELIVLRKKQGFHAIQLSCK